MNVLLVEPNAEPRAIEIDGSPASMQTLVSGLIEAVYPFEAPVALICNDEGKLAGLPQNRPLKHPETGEIYDACPEYGIDFFTNKKSKTNPEVCKAMLEAAIPMLEALPQWTDESIHDGLVSLAETLGVKNATLMWPVRIAAAGKLVTPGGAVEICRILGRGETLRRLRTGLEKLA